MSSDLNVSDIWWPPRATLRVPHGKGDVVGNWLPAHPSSPTSHPPAQAFLGTPIEAPRTTMAQQMAPTSTRREPAQVEGAQVPGPGAPPARPGSRNLGFRGRRQAPGLPGAAAHSAQETLLLGSQPGLRRRPPTRSTRHLGSQSSAGAGGQPGRSDGLWRHLPRKPRRKFGSPGGACPASSG